MTQAIAASAAPSLVPGALLGPYVIEVAIGAGGMGEVYRARDTRLSRTVALKVLPPRFVADPDRRHRFEREARAVASLEHPHICVLHDIGSEAGMDYLVMEHLDGQTLAARLKRGPLKREEALRFAGQIAEALDAAHRRGIVHRDLKPKRLEVKGTVAGLMEGIAQAAYLDNEQWDSGAGQFSVSSSGTLAFVQGSPPALKKWSLARVDRRGTLTPLTTPERDYFSIRFAPDGRRAAVEVREESGVVLWLVDIERGTLTLLEPGMDPRWAPDGRDLAFARIGEGLFRRPAEGPGPTVLLLKDPLRSVPATWTPDGSRLVFVRQVPTPEGAYQTDVLWLDASGPQRATEPLLATPFNESHPEFSPDGRWLAYASNESGRMEVYIQAHPAGIPKVQVSKDQGTAPAWAPSGRELFYSTWPRPNPKLHALMAVPVTTTPRLSVGPARVLFEFDNGRLSMHCEPLRCYDVARDGQSFLAASRPEPPVPPTITHVNLVLNWAEELKARAPARR